MTLVDQNKLFTFKALTGIPEKCILITGTYASTTDYDISC
jgi:hypothetical protein